MFFKSKKFKLLIFSSVKFVSCRFSWGHLKECSKYHFNLLFGNFERFKKNDK